MSKAYSKSFYNSRAWLKCRESYIATVFGLCEHCAGAGYIVDHVEEVTPDNITDPNITLNHKNLQYLCTPCHNKKTFFKFEPTRSDVTFDSEGGLVQVCPPLK